MNRRILPRVRGHILHLPSSGHYHQTISVHNVRRFWWNNSTSLVNQRSFYVLHMTFHRVPPNSCTISTDLSLFVSRLLREQGKIFTIVIKRHDSYHSNYSIAPSRQINFDLNIYEIVLYDKKLPYETHLATYTTYLA